MSATPKFARYIKPGDRIPHPTRGEYGTVETVRYHSPGEWMGARVRPFGTVSGWMIAPDGRTRWGWSYPADSLIVRLP